MLPNSHTVKKIVPDPDRSVFSKENLYRDEIWVTDKKFPFSGPPTSDTARSLESWHSPLAPNLVSASLVSQNLVALSDYRRDQTTYSSSVPVSGPWATSAPAYGPSALTYRVLPQAYAPAPAQPSITIVDPTRYTLIAPQRIHNNAGNKYSWQQDVTNRNYNVLGNQGYAIYSAMHVDNITGASKARDGDHLYANFSSEFGNTNRFQGLRLGEFVYFNFTNQDIFVGGIGNGGGFRVPANNPSQVSEIHPQTSPASQIISDYSKSRHAEPALPQSNLDFQARNFAFDEAKRLRQENTQLTIVSQRQLQSIQDRDLKLTQAKSEIKRLNRQIELDKIEFDRKAKYAASVQLFEDSQRNSSMLRAGREARAADDQRAAAEQEAKAAIAAARAAEARADAAEARAADAEARAQVNSNQVEVQDRGSWLSPILSIFSSAQEKFQSTVFEIRLGVAERGRAEAEQRARDAEQRARDAEREAAKASAEDLQRQLAERDRADARAAEARAAERQARADAAEDRDATLLRQLAANQQELDSLRDWSEPASDARAALAAERARDANLEQQLADERTRANAAEKKVEDIKIYIAGFKTSLENIKTQFEKLKNLFVSEDIKTKPKPNIEYEQGNRQNNFKLKWILNLDQLKIKTTGYNIFLKFTAFSDDHQLEEEQQKALSQVALLKLKLIELGKTKHSTIFLDNKSEINTYLTEVLGVKTPNNFNLDDTETSEFCEEYFLLGQQYRKILEKEKNKPDSNIKKMMSCEFKKDKICYDNESAQEYLGFDENRFEAEFTLVSSKEFNSIINAHSHSSDKNKDDAKKNDDKIILLNSFILSLEQACKGHEEIEKDSPDQIEISPEFAKVFVAIDDAKAKKLWDGLSYEKQIQLKDFLEKELQYSKVEQEGVVGRSKIDIDKYVEARGNMESSSAIAKFIDKRITKQEEKKIKKKFDAPTKEVSDFFEKRKLRCEELLHYKVKDKLEDLSLLVQEEVNSAVEKKNDVFSNFLDLLNQVIIKFNEDFREISRGEGEEEFLPAPASDPDPRAGVRDHPARPALGAPAPGTPAAPATATGATAATAASAAAPARPYS